MVSCCFRVYTHNISKKRCTIKCLCGDLCAKKPDFFPCSYALKWFSHPSGEGGRSKSGLFNRKKVFGGLACAPYATMRWCWSCLMAPCLSEYRPYPVQSTSNHCAQLKGEHEDVGKGRRQQPASAVPFNWYSGGCWIQRAPCVSLVPTAFLFTTVRVARGKIGIFRGHYASLKAPLRCVWDNATSWWIQVCSRCLLWFNGSSGILKVLVEKLGTWAYPRCVLMARLRCFFTSLPTEL